MVASTSGQKHYAFDSYWEAYILPRLQRVRGDCLTANR